MNSIYLVIISSLIGFSHITDTKKNLEIIILNLKNDNGHIMITIEKVDSTIYSQHKLIIQNGTGKLVLNNIEVGDYSVKYFHDTNDNENLDFNMFGIPKEGYGFSNNPDSRFGEPEFEETLFSIQQDTTIKLKTINW